ncbi:unnamed protein product [Didymodactylos carnosus]|uniref:ADP-ribosylation factor-binding protein GGA1 n=1 Tax=Didymodactylos carnosus TaxID=1234261 RepID=A0A814CEQ4_9BILA|nr:unnamed protein product [Didymodactylos carnosus]CAF0941086.1 unnamed protein product [Didymodactylos carnosus]CAF3510632.1 unnamed protein product [Didymodactylos carnosus]CAF3717521.1 unnamed protein product [Didymodactylos carnosus]
MHLYLMRHAESEQNVHPENDSVNCSLTLNGQKQAASLSDYYDLVLCSPLARCRQTLEYANIHYDQLIICNLIREVITCETDLLFEKEQEYETDFDVQKRIQLLNNYLNELKDEKKYNRVLLLSHSDLIWNLTAYEVDGELFGKWLNNAEFKATSPIHKSADPNLVNLFCSKVNADPEGHQAAIRLISHKIQSPQEHEALRTLELLEVCVQSCGRRFHQEIGKFRFLNEMIKLVSPKASNHTSDKVKKKVIELLYSWTQALPTEVKITEAYQMLKRQNIVTDDPTYVDKCILTPLPPRQKSIFDEDVEKSKTLQRLLKSRRPEDLEQANALIKNLVKKDEEKTEKLSNRVTELEKINNNIRVLTEMLVHYNHSSVTDAEKETMKYLHDELEKLRPVLYRLASETEDSDDGLGDILLASDAVSRVLGQYERLVTQGSLLQKDDSALQLVDDIPFLKQSNTSGSATFSSQQPKPKTLIDFHEGNISDAELVSPSSFGSYGPGNEGKSDIDSSKSTMAELDELFSSKPAQSNFGDFTDGLDISKKPLIDQILAHYPTNTVTKPKYNEPSPSLSSTQQQKSTSLLDEPISLTPIKADSLPKSQQAPPPYHEVVSNPSKTKPLPSTGKPFDDLQGLLDQNLFTQDGMQQWKTTPQNFTPSAQVSSGSKRTPLNELAATSKQQSPLASTLAASTNADSSLVDDILPLTNVHVPLETIKPSSHSPLTLLDKSEYGLKCILHFARDSPRADILVSVLSVISTNTTYQIKQFMFQAAVPKTMRVKLQTPSGSDLPVYNPILPPAAITQVMLIANPKKDKIRLRYKISYQLNDDTHVESGDLDQFPSIDLL